MGGLLPYSYVLTYVHTLLGVIHPTVCNCIPVPPVRLTSQVMSNKLHSMPSSCPSESSPLLQVVSVLGFRLPFYKSATLLLSLGLSVRVLANLLKQRPDVIHVSTPGMMCFAAVIYARLLAVPLVMSYHTHIPGEPSLTTCQSLPAWNYLIFLYVPNEYDPYLGCRAQGSAQEK